MKTTMALLGALTLPALPVQAAGIFTDAFDTALNRRVIEWRGAPSPEGIVFSVIASQFKTSAGHATTDFRTQLSTFGDKVRFHGCSASRWEMNGRLYLPLKGQYRMAGLDERYGEYFVAQPTRQDLEWVAMNSRVDYRLCRLRESLSAEDLQGLRWVLQAAEAG